MGQVRTRCAVPQCRVILESSRPRSSADRALASGARSGSSSLPGGTTLFEQMQTAGRSAVVARLVWDQEVGSSSLPAPTSYRLVEAVKPPF